eukprot:TRINITY_DN805_c0_g1::TRINITY_DN805_c0_g1_i1::g.25439::m.25439 TRINITY_DN805_c0_g1::TRINITY_DN805_c0_g1_i1::g.25439  ORF type:complete len:280 (-),score=31.29,DUF1295/PF06966.7/9.9e-60,Steroid_dh/PF02544.11/2.1e+03,Steroid_dh/PF02544.11/7.2e-05,MFS_Mycoplasma/PF07672.8/0.00013,PEMT/PF04191.8/0.00053,ICMT/PF04140.9/0.00098,ERG4_ERG24/PF01222.12/3.7e+02,ERG4_ERG24/PF01222.12/0.41 TRINITY_DN805_c0_g1_i1:160-999(-)
MELSQTELLTSSLAIDFGIQLLGFIHAASLKTEKLYDLCGSGTFLTLALYSFFEGQQRNYDGRSFAASLLTAIWAIRLGVFLFSRVLLVGKDKRFDEVKSDIPKFAIFWFMQGVWVFVSMLPVLLLNSENREGDGLSTLDIIGIALWGFGFLFETIADIQKSIFKANNPETNRWIDTGLWSISRHPNYFGEIIIWVGVYLVCWTGLPTWGKVVGALSPVIVSLLLCFVSGIPILERNADKKWGHLPEYQEYKRTVSVLVPLPFGSCCKGSKAGEPGLLS